MKNRFFIESPLGERLNPISETMRQSQWTRTRCDTLSPCILCAVFVGVLNCLFVRIECALNVCTQHIRLHTPTHTSGNCLTLTRASQFRLDVVPVRDAFDNTTRWARRSEHYSSRIVQCTTSECPPRLQGSKVVCCVYIMQI